MEWLAQCVALVKETLPPGTIITVEEQQARSSKKQAPSGGSGYVLHDKGKRRKVVEDADETPSSSATHNNKSNPQESSTPPQYSWFHPSHPLREDPRVTARRYNNGYDLESEGEQRVASRLDRTNTSSENGERRFAENGTRLGEKSLMEQEPVNYDRVIFAEQVLKPVYHSPYPEIKLSHEIEAISARRAPVVDDAGSARNTSARRSVASSRQQPQSEPQRQATRNGVFKTTGGRTGIQRERTVDAEMSIGGPASPLIVSEGRNGSLNPRRVDADGDSEMASMEYTIAADESRPSFDAPSRSINPRNVSTNPRHPSRPPPRQTQPPSAANQDTTNPGLDQYGLEISPVQASKNQRTVLDEQEYDPDQIRPARPVKPTRNDSRRGDEESTRQRRAVKPTRNGTQDGAADVARAPRSLWVCDRCFKYMPMESAYVSHTKTCSVNFPPGRKVYEKANWGIWEIDGKVDKLYCQNLSLFGKLFIDHKSICFDVEGFHYYVLTDSHPKRDHVIAYFCKEKFSIDDFNLATILVFPHVQQSGFGRLLMEFSYHLTKNSPTPGTPERPLSLLGARSYESLWMAMLVRYLIETLLDQDDDSPKTKGKKIDTYMRVWERRKKVIQQAQETDDYLNYDDLKATPDELSRQEEQLPITITLSVEELARQCNLKTDDLLCLLDALGILDHRRLKSVKSTPEEPEDDVTKAIRALEEKLHLVNWSRMQVAFDFELVVKIVGTWRIPAKPLLDPECCWIEYTGGPLEHPVNRKTWVGFM